MKALMVNSVNSGKVVDGKMRDEIYMRHLREVEKINNREA
jgi:DNA-binding transcriptional regulator YdaS (Cro superfamily)